MSLFIARSALELLLVSWLIFGQARNGRRSSAGAERNQAVVAGAERNQAVAGAERNQAVRR